MTVESAVGTSTKGLEVDAPAAPEPRPADRRQRHGLRRYIRSRLVQAVIVLFIVVTLIFLMSHLAANPVDILLPPGSSPEQRADLTRRLGLDQPLIVQYGLFLKNLLQGDLGTSSLFHVPVLPLVLERAIPTLQLAVAAIVWALVLGVPFGIFLARRQGSLVDRIAGTITALAQGVASFWFGILLIFAFGVKLGWLPVSGDQGPSSMLLPAASLGLAPFVAFVRLTRSAMIDTLASDYVRNARARGLRARIVVGRHALRGALPPVITFGGVLFGQLLSGAVITETIFAWPGIGQLSILGISNGDYGVVEGVTIISATAMVLISLIVDLIYLGINPRAREVVMSGGRI